MPKQLAGFFPSDDVVRAFQLGWSEIGNGDLITVAEEGGFNILVTADQNIRYQQNLAKRRIAIVVLSTNNWNHLRNHRVTITTAVNRATLGSYEEVALPRPALVRREPPRRS